VKLLRPSASPYLPGGLFSKQEKGELVTNVNNNKICLPLFGTCGLSCLIVEFPLFTKITHFVILFVVVPTGWTIFETFSKQQKIKSELVTQHFIFP
jgi:hypothetical protein